MITRVRGIIGFMLALSISGSAAGAQPKPERAAESTAALTNARKLVADGDSVKAIQLLRDAATRDPNNGVLWYEYGSLLSATTRHAWRKSVMPGGVPQMIIAAESSLARASRLEPDSTHYLLAYSRHLWGTNVTSATTATRAQETAYAKFSGSLDSSGLAMSADQLGIMTWRRFEPLIGRGTPLQIDRSLNFLTRKSLVRFIQENYRRPATAFGAGMADEALEHFRKASKADRNVELYFRHEMMVLAEFSRWEEMRTSARLRVAQTPQQAWPWLALGLANYRTHRLADARAAFDSGFARLDPGTRQRLQSIGRIMPQKRSRWYDTLAAPAKTQFHELYWNTANPSMLLTTNPLQDEFRARVVYAELRFTDDDKPTMGASSAKGDVYIRYGPPDIVMQGAIIPRHAQDFAGYDILQSWVYVNELMIYTFGQNRMYGTAYQTMGSLVDYDSSKLDRPVAWTNLPVLRNRIDSVSTQVARFRAGHDSIDVAVFAGYRAGALRRESPVETSTIRHGAFFIDALGREITRTTGTFTSTERDTTRMQSRDYYLRTTAQISAVRVEALEPDLMQAARSINDLTGFTTNGFGISDLLIAGSIGAPDNAVNARWTDYRIAMLAGGAVKRGAPLGLLWESYEPGEVDGSGRLAVSVTVERETARGLVALSGRVVGGLRDAIRGSGAGRLGISYQRQFAAAPVVVDHLILDVGRLDPGRYRVSLTVTDLIRNQKVTRFQRFTIVR